MVEWRKRAVSNEGIGLAVFEVDGSTPDDDDRPTVLLVHGWPDTHHLWTHVAPILARDFHVVAYDCRGFGESDHPAGDAPYRLSLLADDLFAVAEAVSPDEPVHVVAHDWGSVQTWEAVARPGAESRIASFVSVSGPSLDDLALWVREKVSHPTPRNLGQLLAQAGSSAYTVFFQLPVLPRMFFTAVGSARLWRAFLHRVEGTPPHHAVVGSTLRADMISGLRLYRANIAPTMAAPQPATTFVPVLEVINERDIALRPAIFDGTHRRVQRLWRLRTPTGHWLPYTHPEYLADVARDFIATHAPAAGVCATGHLDRARLFGVPTPLSGKLAVITAAGNGLGRELAFALAEMGCALVLADTDLPRLEETARESKAFGAQVSTYDLDLSDTATVRSFAESVHAAHGSPDIVVNNAGIVWPASTLGAADDDVHHLLEVEGGVIASSRAFGRQMAERGVGGHIVNVGPAVTSERSRGSAAWAGVITFSASLRSELAGRRVGVTSVRPGPRDSSPSAARAVVAAIIRNKPVVTMSSDTTPVHRIAARLSRITRRHTV